MYTDTHCHISFNDYDDIPFLINKIKENGVGKIIVNGCDMESNLEVLELTKKYDIVYGALGFHPTELDNFDENNLIWLDEHINDDKIVALGEIGLDYHWNTPTPEIQQKYFIEQIELAKKLNLPISIHSRDAETDTLKIIKDHYDENLKGVIHCYSYGLDSAKEYLDMGFYFGIGGTSTYKGNDELRQVVEFLPIENIVLETDCPYLSPVPKRGKRNDSSNLIYVAENIANIKGLSTQEVINITNQNAKKLYNLK
jgi:TatD DNase family protein